MERRSCRRVKADAEIILLQGNRLYTAKMTNISKRGIMVTSRVKLDSDAELGVHGAGEFMMSGNIRWMRQRSGCYDIGCTLLRE